MHSSDAEIIRALYRHEPTRVLIEIAQESMEMAKGTGDSKLQKALLKMADALSRAAQQL